MDEALEDYLALIEAERDRRPAEAMLADEIFRLRAREQVWMGNVEAFREALHRRG